MTEISAHVLVSDETRKRWEKLIGDRGYRKGAFIRSFIEAVTDPVRGEEIERIIQDRKRLPEVQR